MAEKVKEFIKKETVLVIACILAVVSCFFVKPDKEYVSYIDFHTILILFCLMVVMAGLKNLGLFQKMGEILLKKFHSERGIFFVLVFLCFISSMFITNDVALITFVPLAVLVLDMAKLTSKVCLTVTFMTIAANLGSMLTPIGNPQNLYLYAKSGISLGSFLMLMLPFTAAAATLLDLCAVLFFQPKGIDFSMEEHTGKIPMQILLFYLFLFVLCLLNVAKLLPIGILAVIVIAAVFLQNKRLFAEVDYSLLATFICFFIFIGNMGRLPMFCDFIMSILDGHERLVAIASSQVISNVPAALLLSGFTIQWKELIIGTNLGGLGTLIASMASLISYKQIAQNYPDKKGRYFKIFTIWNLVFLVILYMVGMMI